MFLSASSITAILQGRNTTISGMTLQQVTADGDIAEAEDLDPRCALVAEHGLEVLPHQVVADDT
jgi:hypothetical protein